MDAFGDDVPASVRSGDRHVRGDLRHAPSTVASPSQRSLGESKTQRNDDDDSSWLDAHWPVVLIVGMVALACVVGWRDPKARDASASASAMQSATRTASTTDAILVLVATDATTPVQTARSIALLFTRAAAPSRVRVALFERTSPHVAAAAEAAARSDAARWGVATIPASKASVVARALRDMQDAASLPFVLSERVTVVLGDDDVGPLGALYVLLGAVPHAEDAIVTFPEGATPAKHWDATLLGVLAEGGRDVVAVSMVGTHALGCFSVVKSIGATRVPVLGAAPFCKTLGVKAQPCAWWSAGAMTMAASDVWRTGALSTCPRSLWSLPPRSYDAYVTARAVAGGCVLLAPTESVLHESAALAPQWAALPDTTAVDSMLSDLTAEPLHGVLTSRGLEYEVDDEGEIQVHATARAALGVKSPVSNMDAAGKYGSLEEYYRREMALRDALALAAQRSHAALQRSLMGRSSLI